MYVVEYYVLVTAVCPYSQLLGVGSIGVSSFSGEWPSVPLRKSLSTLLGGKCLDYGKMILNGNWFIPSHVSSSQHSFVHVLHQITDAHSFPEVLVGLAQACLKSLVHSTA